MQLSDSAGIRKHNRVARVVKEESFRQFLDYLLISNNNRYAFWKALKILDNNYYLKVRDQSLDREEEIRSSWIGNFTIANDLLIEAASAEKPVFWAPKIRREKMVQTPTGADIERILRKKPQPGCPGPGGIHTNICFYLDKMDMN